MYSTYREFFGIEGSIVCSQRFSRVIDEEFYDVSWETAFTALRTRLLVGQPLRQTERERERFDSSERERGFNLTMCSEKCDHLCEREINKRQQGARVLTWRR